MLALTHSGNLPIFFAPLRGRSVSLQSSPWRLTCCPQPGSAFVRLAPIQMKAHPRELGSWPLGGVSTVPSSQQHQSFDLRPLPPRQHCFSHNTTYRYISLHNSPPLATSGNDSATSCASSNISTNRTRLLLNY